MYENMFEIMNDFWNKGEIRKQIVKRRIFAYEQREGADDIELLIPGEYIALVAYHTRRYFNDDTSSQYGKYIFAKVLSVKKANFWNGQASTQVEFQDGTTAVLHPGAGGREALWKFFPKDAFKRSNIEFGSKDAIIVAYSFTDMPYLKKALELQPQFDAAIKERKLELERRQREAEIQKRQEEEELRRRNNSVSASEIDRLFRK